MRRLGSRFGRRIEGPRETGESKPWVPDGCRQVKLIASADAAVIVRNEHAGETRSFM